MRVVTILHSRIFFQGKKEAYMNFDFLAFNQFGFFNPSWFEFILIALLLTHITIVGVTVYLHRHSAHRSLELATPVKHFFRFWLWLTTGMNTKA